MNNNIESYLYESSILNGSNFSNWKFKMQTLLESANTWSIIIGNELRLGSAAQEQNWDKRETKAKVILKMSIKDNVIRHIRDCKLATDIWTTIKNLYQTQNTNMSCHSKASYLHWRWRRMSPLLDSLVESKTWRTDWEISERKFLIQIWSRSGWTEWLMNTIFLSQCCQQGRKPCIWRADGDSNTGIIMMTKFEIRKTLFWWQKGDSIEGSSISNRSSSSRKEPTHFKRNRLKVCLLIIFPAKTVFTMENLDIRLKIVTRDRQTKEETNRENIRVTLLRKKRIIATNFDYL